MRGNGGRELLRETLRERGARRDVCGVLSALCKTLRWRGRSNALARAAVNTLVVTSGEMLQQLWSLIPLWYRENWLLRCRLLVVSERLANHARELGWQEIRIAENADNDALLRALQ